ncbi:MAG TPA: hypothetical protein VN956_23980 [Pyrinomonadaceae bacterium]|nr:hypothetical protein [Pyrinomonadaceae bacterium]
MSNEFFLDTAYAIALSVESDQHHQRAEELAEQLQFDSAEDTFLCKAHEPDRHVLRLLT